LKSVSVRIISITVFYPRLSAITAEIRVLFSCKKKQDYILFADAIGTQIDADMTDLKYGFYLLRKWRIPGNSELHRRNPLTSLVEVGIRKNNQCNRFLSAFICYNRGNPRSIYLQKKQDYILFAAVTGTRTNADMADLKYGFYLLRKWRIPGNSGAAQAQSADFNC
jgi:hypothetical protein